MASVFTSQTSGVTAPMLEEARRRMRERGEKAPYAPSVSGLDEHTMESAITRAQVGEQDTDDAVDDVRGAAQMKLRAPMSGPTPRPGFQLEQPMTGALTLQPPAPALRAPGVAPAPDAPVFAGKSQTPNGPPQLVDPLDARDEENARRFRRQRIGLAMAQLAGGIFGDPATAAQRSAALGPAIQSIDPQAPLRARDERHAATAQAAIDAEKARVDADYQRSLTNSMDVNARRREFEMTRSGERDERNYDPEAANAGSYRDALTRIIASHPTTQAAFGSLDTSQMGARDLQGLADRVLRLRSQIPNRDRGVDDDDLAAIIAGLGEQPAAPVVEAPAEPAPVAAARRRTAARNGAPTAAPTATAPATRRDRTVAQINADRLMVRRGAPPPSGYMPDDLTPGEALSIARSMETRGNRAASARIAGGVDTQSREAQFQQTGQTGTFTEPDIARATRIMQPIERQSRQLRGLLANVDRISDEEFRQAMQGGNLAALGLNASDFAAAYAAYANPELRERSGAAVTDSEYQRFQQEFSAGRLNSKEQFKRAVARVLNEVRANSRSFNLRPDLVEHVRARRAR